MHLKVIEGYFIKEALSRYFLIVVRDRNII
jgi:hypothetical protein